MKTKEEYYEKVYRDKLGWGYPKEFAHLLAKRDASRYVLDDLKRKLYRAVIEEKELSELCKDIRMEYKKHKTYINKANEYAKRNNI